MQTSIKSKKLPLEFSEKYGFKTSPERSKIMAKIKATDTKQEVRLRKLLWSHGYRYRKNLSGLIGKPDIVFTKFKLIIFIDGGFWHGYKWKRQKAKLKSNREFWIRKIERNMERDKQVNKELRRLGWTVLRYWEHDLVNDMVKCFAEIEAKLVAPANEAR